MPDPLDYPGQRQPPPAKRVTPATLSADQEREKRRQQRPVRGDATRPSDEGDDHLNVSDAWVGAAADSPPLSTFAGGLWGCVAYCRLTFDAPSDGLWRAELTWIHSVWGGADGSADQVRAETGDPLQFKLTAPHTYRSLSSFQARPYLTLRLNGSTAGSPSATADTLRIEIDCDRYRGTNGLQNAYP